MVYRQLSVVMSVGKQSNYLNSTSIIIGQLEYVVSFVLLFDFLIDDSFQFACIDNTGQFLAVAGQHGFVHFSLLTRKWKLFGNAGQVNNTRSSCILRSRQDFFVLIRNGIFESLEVYYGGKNSSSVVVHQSAKIVMK